MHKQLFSITFFSFVVFSSTQAGSLNLSYVSDSANVDSRYIDLSFDASKQTQLYLGAGKSTIKDSAGEITISSFNLGLFGIANEDFDYDIGYSFWGNKNEISSATAYFGLSLYTENWKFTLRPELQKILLYTKNNRRQVDINGTGLYNSVQYFGINNIELLYAHNSYNYNRNLSALNTRLASLFFSNTALLLGSSFLETRDLAEIAFIPATIRWLPERITLSYSQSVNAIDKSVSKTLSAKLNINLTSKISIELEAGEVRPKNRDKLTFGAVSVLFYF